MNKKCQVFTPKNYVNRILDSVGYMENLYDKNVLENSCGDGNVIVAVAERYIDDARKSGISDDEISDGLSKHIIGVELDPVRCEECLKRLNELADRKKLGKVKWSIINADFLRWNTDMQFQYIVGNPPYITYQELDKTEREYVRTTYDSCKKGKFDYCYAFIEKSLSLLSNDGKMSYLVPGSIFKTVYGLCIRKQMRPFISEIIDFTQEKVFDSALVKSLIIVLNKGIQVKTINYIDSSTGISQFIEKDGLGDKWVFKDIGLGKRRFGDYFKVSHVVATLLNEAFVLNQYMQNDSGDYVFGEHIIEREIVRDTASPKSQRTKNKEKIVFPYYYDNDRLVHYSENDLKKCFPGAYNYLLSHKEKLTKRACDKNTKWFEYGRTQALSSLNCNKCLISTVFSSEMAVYELDEECIPYAGMFIVPKKGNIEYSLEDAAKILKSNSFRKYVEGVGIHINGKSIRITSRDVENYMFDA